MKDQILFLLSGIACAFGAWAFWRYLDAEAVVVFNHACLGVGCGG